MSDVAKAEDSKTESLPRHLTEINPDEVDWKSKDINFWKSVLTADQFAVCRQAGTERPFSGKYCALKAQGEYRCACCGQLLFSSGDKFDSGTGWPSFTEAAKKRCLTGAS